MDIYGFNAPHLPLSLLSSLATSEPRLWMYGSDLVHGALRLLHLLGAAMFIGTVLPVNLMQLGIFPATTLAPARPPLLRLLSAGFWLAVVSGLLLFLYDPIGTGLHTMFLPKLALVTIGYVAAKWPPGRPAPILRPRFAACSLMVWFLVMGCSTWNRIEHPRNPGDVLALEAGRD